MNQKPVVAVVNSNDDVIEALREVIEDEGYSVATGHVSAFKRDTSSWVLFLRQFDPRVVIFDMAPPYEDNWRFFQLASGLEIARNRSYVLTTTNEERLRELTGATAIEILGKPSDLGAVVAAIARAIAA